MKKTLFSLTLFAFCLGSCALDRNRDDGRGGGDRPGDSPVAANNTAANENKGAGQAGGKAGDQTRADKSACLELKIAGRRVDPKQTFPIDFEPFRASCFVTAHDPEFTDPPLGSEFYIYRDGREVSKLPDSFNGTTTGCWAEAVAFQDLNADGLTDVVIAGMCSAKASPYSENMVYVNTGRDFATSPEANSKLNDFRKIKDISDFVKRNQEQFFN